MRFTVYLLFLIGLWSSPLAAQEEPKSVDFDRDIRPILSDRCYFCHGPDAKQRQAGPQGCRRQCRRTWSRPLLPTGVDGAASPAAPTSIGSSRRGSINSALSLSATTAAPKWSCRSRTLCVRSSPSILAISVSKRARQFSLCPGRGPILFCCQVQPRQPW